MTIKGKGFLAILWIALMWTVYAFVTVSVVALGFRWAFTAYAELLHWVTVSVLNPLAGIFPFTS